MMHALLVKVHATFVLSYAMLDLLSSANNVLAELPVHMGKVRASLQKTAHLVHCCFITITFSYLESNGC